MPQTIDTVNAARDHYIECNRKLNHLIDQIEMADSWNNEAITELNRQIEIAGNETQAAMQTWNEAVNTLCQIPEEEEPATATMAEWEVAARLIPPGYRLKDGFWHDRAGRCSEPPVVLTKRQTNILAGVIPIR